MNLIDILNQILSTKNEIKEIIKDIDYSDDFSRYGVSVHNFIASIYNQGYINGYNTKYQEELGIESYPENPIKFKDYVAGSNDYDPFSPDGLTAIMSDVLGYRLEIKEEINTDSDYFPYYPGYLNTLSNTLYNTGYDDGINAASEDILPSEAPETPTLSISNNSFTITSSQEGATLYYKLGEDGKTMRYSSTVYVSDDYTVYAWAQIGKSKSDITSGTCTYDPEYDSVVLNPPYISRDINTIYLTSSVEGSMIHYKVDDGDWMIYSAPFEIVGEGTHSITYFSVRENVVSRKDTENFEWIDPTVTDTRQKCSNVILTQDDDNTITMTCPTDGATIYYKINSGSYSVYSAPFVISERCTIYTYSAKTGYKDSDIIYWPLEIIEIYEKPQTPTARTDNAGTLIIRTSTIGAHIVYRIGNIGSYVEVNSTIVRLSPTEDCTVYAYARKNNTDSEQMVYEYTYYSFTFNLPPPTIELINNRIVMSSDYTIWYTLDGRDPRVYGTVYVAINDGFNGIGISETTTVRAVSTSFDSDYRNHFSPEEVKTFSPIMPGEEGYVYSSEYFNIIGASEIHLTGTVNAGYNLSYSTDRREWIGFTKDVTGLDRNTRYYLQSYGTNNYKVFDSMYFGTGDEVTVSGNVLSIVMNGDFSVYTSPNTEMSLYKLFYNCKELIDAKNLVIPYNSLVGKDLKWAFYGCSNLINAPSDLYFTELKEESMYQTFYGCSKLKLAPKMNVSVLGKKSCFETFRYCTSLSNVNRFDISDCGSDSCLEGIFSDCTSLVSVNMSIDGEMGKRALAYAFYNCVSFDNRSYINTLSYIDNIKVNSTNTNEYCFYHTFDGCSSLKHFGHLPAESASYSCYESMFKDCTSLEDIEGIGLLSVHERCCYGMFENCRLMTNAPELLVSNLTRRNCYSRMFYNCERLNYIKAIFLTDPHGGTYTSEWVYGVSDNGTFIQDSDAVWFEESVDAIPIGWGVGLDENAPGRIVSFNLIYDKVVITASNGNPIYYQINSDDEDGEWILYTGPIMIDHNCKIYARCKSNRGVFGRIAESEYFRLEIPELIISSQDNIVTISKPTNYEYGTIYYRLYTYGQHNLIQDWTVYTSSFPIETSVTIDAYGVKSNGSDGPRTQKDIIYGISLPNIRCVDNIVTITCSTPNLYRILYKIDNPGDSESGWTQYQEPFLIDHTCTVTSKAQIVDPYNGRVYSSGVIDTKCIYDPNGESYVIHSPVFERRNNTNEVYVIYSGHGYTVWENDEISVMYRINGGEWKKYVSLITFNTDVTIDTFAIDTNGKTSPTISYSFTFDPDAESIYVPAPRIEVLQDSSHMYWLYITNTDPRATNIYRFSDVEPVGANNHSEWSNLNGGTIISSSIRRATITAISNIGSYSSEPSTYQYTKESTPVVIIPDPPTIRFNTTTNIISISATLYTTIFYSFDGVNYEVYTTPITINRTLTCYSYVIYNGQSSSINSRVCEYSQSGGGGDDPSGEYSINDYLTFEMIDSGYVKWVYNGDVSSEGVYDIEYKKNDGNWTNLHPDNEYESQKTTIYLNAGDKISFRGDHDGYTIPNGIQDSWWGYHRFTIEGRYNLCGNINSLIDSSGFSSITTLTTNYTFQRFFSGSKVVNASEFYLPALNVSRGSYYAMFASCGFMTTPLKTISATTLGVVCYDKMFYNCNSLITPPALPATILEATCYREMFSGCSALTKTPDLLAPTLVGSCYRMMFTGCNSLVYAKVMAQYRYDQSSSSAAKWDVGMFGGVINVGTFVVSNNSCIYDSSNPTKYQENGVYNLINDYGWTLIESVN